MKQTEMHPLWRTELGGIAAHQVAVEPASGSIYVSDGWGVSYASLSMRRIDVHSGEVIERVRTRHQFVGAILPCDGDLWVATSKRIERRDPETLELREEWRDGIVRDIQHLVILGDWLIGANWRTPTLQAVNILTGASKRVTGITQPVVATRGGSLVVLGGQAGGIREWDPAAENFGPKCTGPIVTSAQEVDGELWCVKGGESIEQKDSHGVVYSQHRAASRLMIRHREPTITYPLASRTDHLHADSRGQLWGFGVREDAYVLEKLRPGSDQSNSSLVAPGTSGWVAVDSGLGLAFAVQRRASGDNQECDLFAVRIA